MASPEEVTQLTGLKIGAIPPVGKAINLPSYFDQSLKSNNQNFAILPKFEPALPFFAIIWQNTQRDTKLATNYKN